MGFLVFYSVCSFACKAESLASCSSFNHLVPCTNWWRVCLSNLLATFPLHLTWGEFLEVFLLGYIYDRLNARAITAGSFMCSAIPSMVLYRLYGSISLNINIALMMVTGLFLNGPYTLITTAVSADLGKHSSLRGNSLALATVIAIIDITGSVGAALDPLLTGFISRKGWDEVFTFYYANVRCFYCSASSITSIAEITEKTGKPIPFTSALQNPGAPASQPLIDEER